MPTYEYECTKCENRFEVFQKMTDSPVKSCPKCRGRVNRLIGLGGGVIYKGPGFYTTEYRSEHYKQRQKQEESGCASSSSSCSSSSSSSKCSGCSATSCSTCSK